METYKLKKIMADVADGKLSPDNAVDALKFMPFEDLGYAKIDHHRALRKGFPEVVFCQSKTVKQVVEIVKKLFILFLEFPKKIIRTEIMEVFH